VGECHDLGNKDIMIERFEVIVVGGGIVGATAACILAEAGIKTALINEKQPQKIWPDDTVDLRVSALTRASQNILEKIDVWPTMKKRGVGPYYQMRVWDANGNGELHFDCADTEFDQLGHIVENRITVASLWDQLEILSDASLICPATVDELQEINRGWRVLMADGDEYEADLVIAADGRDSRLREMRGIGTTGWAYQQDGLVATVTTEKHHQNTAWQRFLSEGPLAFLPLANGQCSIVWTLSTETSEKYQQLNDDDFLFVLEQASAGILGKMIEVGPRAKFPLRFQFARRYIGEHFVLIGDAAHAMHPLAGQGANAGLLDAAAITELIIQAKRANRPIASQRVLRRFERWRKGDNLTMMASMDAINKIFKVSVLPLVMLRSDGMNRINKNDLIKQFFNRYAMGLRSDLPSLAHQNNLVD
jgi:2-octaprenylphenol hydroxylase